MDISQKSTRYQINPEFIQPFLESLPNKDTRIFLAIILIALIDIDIEIDIEAIEELVNLPRDYVARAVEIYNEKSILLRSQDD